MERQKWKLEMECYLLKAWDWDRASFQRMSTYLPVLPSQNTWAQVLLLFQFFKSDPTPLTRGLDMSILKKFHTDSDSCFWLSTEVEFQKVLLEMSQKDPVI